MPLWCAFITLLKARRMIFFDSFPSTESADQFCEAVAQKFGVFGRVCKDQEEADKYEFFPFQARESACIVLVPRCDFETERLIDLEAELVGGRLLGT